MESVKFTINGHIIGRPTVYDPAFCQIVIDCGLKGKTITQMACELGIVKDTLYRWEKEIPEFSDALSYARQYSQSYWEDIGHDCLYSDKFQANVYNKQMSCRFPNDWRDKVENTNFNHTPVIIRDDIPEDKEDGSS